MSVPASEVKNFKKFAKNMNYIAHRYTDEQLRGLYLYKLRTKSEPHTYTDEYLQQKYRISQNFVDSFRCRQFSDTQIDLFMPFYRQLDASPDISSLEERLDRFELEQA